MMGFVNCPFSAGFHIALSMDHFSCVFKSSLCAVPSTPNEHRLMSWFQAFEDRLSWRTCFSTRPVWSKWREEKGSRKRRILSINLDIFQKVSSASLLLILLDWGQPCKHSSTVGKG